MNAVLDEQTIYSLPFSIDLFKKLPFRPELEVIITADGTIFYARPSHQEAMIRFAMEKNHCSRYELEGKCPPEYYCDYMGWLVGQSGGCIPVWDKFFIGKHPTKPQINALKKLKLAGLYHGKLTKGI